VVADSVAVVDPEGQISLPVVSALGCDMLAPLGLLSPPPEGEGSPCATRSRTGEADPVCVGADDPRTPTHVGEAGSPDSAWPSVDPGVDPDMSIRGGSLPGESDPRSVPPLAVFGHM
jgi:hypothetical protein